MKKLALTTAISLLMISPALAQQAGPELNLEAVELCIDNNSFSAQVGALGSTSQKVAQDLYDYFVKSATEDKVPFKEMGNDSCGKWAVDFTVEATEGNPRAWLANLVVSDNNVYASLDKNDVYPYPVVVWWDSYFGYTTSNDGLAEYLIDAGKDLIDGLLDDYTAVN